MTGQLLILAKHPVPGRVKTRLCPPCTPDQAATIAAAALRDTIDAVRRTRVHRRVLALDADSTVDDFAVIRQRGAGLGERIAHAFADTTAGGSGPVLQLGMDTPQVRPAMLAEALDQLSYVDAVLGPAEDGGWWALGLRDPAHAAALTDVPMSTPDTGRLTVEALRRRALRIQFLPTLRDVDTFTDATAVAATVPESHFAHAVREVAEVATCTVR